jgi:hypothetical protein
MSKRSVVILGSALALLLGGLQTGASAAVSAWEHVNAFAGSSANKSVSVSCPAGKRALSPGVFLDLGGTNQVILDDLRPSADLTSVTAQGLEDETGTTANWFLSTSAKCAVPPPGLQRVSATSALNSSNKSVTVNCPAGKRVLGVGADINAGNGQVLFDDIRPNAALTAVTVQALEDETGQSGPWSVTAYAVCADPIAGLERVATTSALDSGANKPVITSCPSGKLATGVGADINAGSGQVLFNVFDVSSSGSVLVQGTEDETGFSGPWSVTAYAICAPVARRESTTSFGSSDPKNVNLTCEFSGQQVTGLGGGVIAGAQEVVLDRLRPDPPNNALATAFEDEGGFAGSWQLSSNAVCATPFPGQEIVSATSAQNSVAAKGITATCPGTKRVLGAAGEVVNGLGQVFLTSVRPSADLTGATAFAVEDENGTNASWGLVARAICADPPPGLERVSATSASDSASTKSVTASCPAGKSLLSTGFDLESSLGQVSLLSLGPNALLSQATAAGSEDATGNAIDWTVIAYGVCALP